MPTDMAIAAPTLTVDRKNLLTALARVGWVVPKRSYKPILEGVHLEALDGRFRLTATDMDFNLYTTVEAQGGLPPCVVSCDELTRRLKAGKADVCTLALDAKGEYLNVNGGQVDHRLHTLELGEFPPVFTNADGKRLTLPGLKTKDMLAIANVASAQDSTRYALNGILLEADKAGVRLIATDGRRMVRVELGEKKGNFRGQVILPRRIASLVGKLMAKKENGDDLTLTVSPNKNEKGEKEPADLYLAGSDWTLSCKEVDGSFPQYKDIWPASHSKFIVDRQAFIDTLSEVALASNEENRGVRLHLSAEQIRLSAGLSDMAESSGTVPCSFAGGGDDSIITGFNPVLLIDALKHVPGEKAVLDLAQNRHGLDGKVYGCPMLVYGLDHLEVQWLLMPINLGLTASRECLGSNFPVEETPATPAPEAPAPPIKRRRKRAESQPEAAATPLPMKRRAENAWPEIGTELEGSYHGQIYTAVVSNAPNLKSGRALQVTSGPAAGQVFRSPTGAMEAATYAQREQLGLGKSKKGLPSSGWEFWQRAQRKRATA